MFNYSSLYFSFFYITYGADSAADRAVIWLGKKTPTSKGGFKIMGAICAQHPVRSWLTEVQNVGYLAGIENCTDWGGDFELSFGSLASPNPGSPALNVERVSRHEGSDRAPLPLILRPIYRDPISELLRHP